MTDARRFWLAYSVLYALAALLLLPGCAPKPVGVSEDQYRFDQACLWASGVTTTTEPLLQTLDLDADARLAVTSLMAFVKETCSRPLDVADSKAVTQRVWDAAGRVVEAVVNR